MKTQQGPSQEPSQSVDPKWKGCYWAEALAIILAAVLYTIQPFLMVLEPKAPAAGDAFLKYVDRSIEE